MPTRAKEVQCQCWAVVLQPLFIASIIKWSSLLLQDIKLGPNWQICGTAMFTYVHANSTRLTGPCSKPLLPWSAVLSWDQAPHSTSCIFLSYQPFLHKIFGLAFRPPVFLKDQRTPPVHRATLLRVISPSNPQKEAASATQVVLECYRSVTGELLKCYCTVYLTECHGNFNRRWNGFSEHNRGDNSSFLQSTIFLFKSKASLGRISFKKMRSKSKHVSTTILVCCVVSWVWWVRSLEEVWAQDSSSSTEASTHCTAVRSSAKIRFQDLCGILCFFTCVWYIMMLVISMIFLEIHLQAASWAEVLAVEPEATEAPTKFCLILKAVWSCSKYAEVTYAMSMRPSWDLGRRLRRATWYRWRMSTRHFCPNFRPVACRPQSFFNVYIQKDICRASNRQSNGQTRLLMLA